MRYEVLQSITHLANESFNAYTLSFFLIYFFFNFERIFTFTDLENWKASKIHVFCKIYQ